MFPNGSVIIESYKPDKSILIDLVVNANKCLASDNLPFINEIKLKLDDVYRNVADFERVVIKEIQNFK
jgi:hypothetical protein